MVNTLRQWLEQSSFSSALARCKGVEEVEMTRKLLYSYSFLRLESLSLCLTPTLQIPWLTLERALACACSSTLSGSLSCSLLILMAVKGSSSEKKRDYVGKISKWRIPPSSPPSLGNPCYQKKKVGFIFHFRTSGTFLVFTKKSKF